jgi:uncharacterized protein (DUF849 family)
MITSDCELIISFTATGMVSIKEQSEHLPLSRSRIVEETHVANSMAISMGAGVRVGLEDNLFWDSGRRNFATNQSLLDHIHDLAEIHHRKIMSPSTFRIKLNLGPESGCCGIFTAQPEKETTC